MLSAAAVFQNVIINQCRCSQLFLKIFIYDAFLQVTSENIFDLFSFRLW